MSLEIHEDFLPYAMNLEGRAAGSIDLVVIHCTELPDLAMARTFGERVHYPETGTGNSGHFYIDRDGHVEQWVPIDRVAHHVRGFNPRSIGIELVNNGRYPDWFDSRKQTMSEPYPEQQVEALVLLVNRLSEHVPSLVNVAGHEDLDTALIASENAPDTLIRRKLDPGPHFPWPAFMERTHLHRFFADRP